MGNTAYIGSSSLLKKAYINCTCIYEVGTALVLHAVLKTAPQGSLLLPLKDVTRYGAVSEDQVSHKLAGKDSNMKGHCRTDVTGFMHGAVREQLSGALV